MNKRQIITMSATLLIALMAVLAPVLAALNYYFFGDSVNLIFIVSCVVVLFIIAAIISVIIHTSNRLDNINRRPERPVKVSRFQQRLEEMEREKKVNKIKHKLQNDFEL